MKIKKEILLWLQENNISNYVIDKNNKVNIIGDLIIEKNYEALPISFGIVTGSFMCNGLKSLKGCPVEVGKNVEINQAVLRNLIGCPLKIGGFLSFGSSRLESCKGLSPKVGGYIALGLLKKFKNNIYNLDCTEQIDFNNCMSVEEIDSENKLLRKFLDYEEEKKRYNYWKMNKKIITNNISGKIKKI